MTATSGTTETATVTWQAMTATPGATEVLAITWQPFAAGTAGAETIGGETIASDGSGPFTANQVAQAAAGSLVAGLTIAQSPSAWTVTGQSGATTAFTSTTPNAPVSSPADANGSGSAAAAPSYAVTAAGAAPVNGGTESVGGETVTGNAAFTANQVAQVAGGGAAVPGLSITTAPTLWTVGPASGATTVFTSTTPDAPAAAPAAGSFTGDAAAPAQTVTSVGSSPGGATVSSPGPTTAPPSVTAVGVPANGDYGAGITLNFAVVFSQAVTVDTSGGTPTIPLTLAQGNTVAAAYVAGSGSNVLTFSYSVAPNTPMAVPAVGPAIVLNGATIQDAVGDPAALGLNGVQSTAGVSVDGTAPTIYGINTLLGSPTDVSTLTFDARFTKPVTGVTASDFGFNGTGSVTDSGLSVSGSGADYTVTLSGVAGNGTASIDFAFPPGTVTGIQDAYGNHFTSYNVSAESYAVHDAAPTVPTRTVQVGYGAVATPLGIQAPTDPNYTAAQLTTTVTSLPTNGTVMLPGQAAVTVGEVLTVAQLTALDFTATPGVANTTSSLRYSVSDPIGHTTPGIAAVSVGSNLLPPVFNAPDEIVNISTPTLFGSAAAGSTVTLLQGNTVLGTATASSSGSFAISPTAALSLGPNSLTATDTTAAGTSAATSLSLLVLPDPVDGVSSSTITAATLAAALGGGALPIFVRGTESATVQGGTLSVGPDTTEAFVERLYRGLLDRPADPAGLSAFDAQLNAGASKAQIATDILNSPEYLAHHGAQTPQQLVSAFYDGFLGRVATLSPGSNFWLNQLAQGASPGAVAAGIADSAEAKTHLAGDTAQVYVPQAITVLATELYETALGRAPDPASLATIIATEASISPAQFATDITGSSEFASRHAGQSNAALVNSFYQNGLGRAPDPVGGASATALLNGGTSAATVLLGIATSPESGAHQAPLLSV